MPKHLALITGSAKASLAIATTLLFAACGGESGSMGQDGGATDADSLPDADLGTPIDMIPSTPIEGTVLCEKKTCDVAIAASKAPTFSHSRGRADRSSDLVFDAPERTGLYWASSRGVTRLTTGRYEDFSRPVNGRIWISFSDSTLIEVDQLGRVWQELAAPADEPVLTPFVEQVGDALLYGGMLADEDNRDSRTWSYRAGTWTEITVLENWADDAVAINDEYALLLGYGYYNVWHIDDGVVELGGGSDDIFDSAVRCSTNDFWVGGGTGMQGHCAVPNLCDPVEVQSNTYVFGPSSFGCVDGDLVSFVGGEFLKVEPGGATSSSPAPQRLRHFWTDLDVTWNVVEP